MKQPENKLETKRRASGAWLTEVEARQVNEAFAGLSPDAGLFQALDLLLAAHEACEVMVALDPGLTPEQRQFWAGNAYAIPRIRDLLTMARKGELPAPAK